MSLQSRPSANDRGNNKMIQGPVHRFTAEENTGKSQLGDLLMKAVRPAIASNGGVPYHQMTSVGSHSTSGMEKDGKKNRIGRDVEQYTPLT